jgi:translation initiation factor IF-1
MVKKIIAYALICVFVVPAAIGKQTTDSPEIWKAFAEKLEPGAFIRVRLKDGHQVKGHFVIVDDRSIRVNPNTRIPVPLREFAFTDIASIDRQREGWSPGGKVLAGVAIGVGAALLIALGIYAAAGYD